MFIPRGKPVHENLSTSFVLLDALVADLCEGAFSGIVEIALREANAYVIIDSGKVLASIGKRADAESHPAYSPLAIESLSERARRERGHISVYSHSDKVTRAVANRLLAEPLYIGLSTDFADLNKMIAKLRRETDRQWFIEVGTISGKKAMIHIDDDRCRIIKPDQPSEEVETGDLDPADNIVLRDLLEESTASGSTFDVYYRYIAEEEEVYYRHIAPQEDTAVRAAAEAAPALESDFAFAEIPAPAEPEPLQLDEEELAPALTDEAVDFEMDLAEEVTALRETSANGDRSAGEEVEEAVEAVEEVEEDAAAEETTPSPAALKKGLSANTMRLLSLASLGEVESSKSVPENTKEMEDVKRLMGEIARTIEGATKEVEPGDSFSIYLRAGQLKVADRYPFLDPFGAEFEYLAGEIAFVGHASTDDFIEGLTEALRHAVAGVVQTSVQPTRLRIYIVEDLRQLLASNRADFERYGLDKTIDQVINF